MLSHLKLDFWQISGSVFYYSSSVTDFNCIKDIKFSHLQTILLGKSPRKFCIGSTSGDLVGYFKVTILLTWNHLIILCNITRTDCITDISNFLQQDSLFHKRYACVVCLGIHFRLRIHFGMLEYTFCSKREQMNSYHC